MRHHLAAKYARRPPQVVVALGDPAVPFAIDTRDRLWPDAGLVAATNSEAMAARVRQTRRAVALAFTLDLRETIAVARAVLPDTDTLALVGASDAYLPHVEAQLAAHFPDLRVIRLVDLPLADLHQRVAALPARSVVLYTRTRSTRTAARTSRGWCSRTSRNAPTVRSSGSPRRTSASGSWPGRSATSRTRRRPWRGSSGACSRARPPTASTFARRHRPRTSTPAS